VFYIVYGCLLFLWVGKGGRLLHNFLPAITYLSPGYCIPVSLHPLDVSCPAVLLSLNLSKRRNILFNPILNFRFVLKETRVPAAARSNTWVCGRSHAEFVGWNPGGAWMFVRCENCLLSGRGLCVGLIARPEESYRGWCVQ
jgi:hypothetical protein